MTHDDRSKWDARHRAGTYDHGLEPVAFLREHVHLVAPGTAIDLACGSGRNALFLAERGFDVLAVDLSSEALARVESRARERGLRLRTLQRDLAGEGMPPGAWELVVVTYFLDRSLFAPIREAVTPGGAVVFETYTVRHSERTGFNRAYCLEPGELPAAFEGFEVVAYREEAVGAKDVASILARRPKS